jgi:DNA-binding NtrC family response regulator
MGRDDTTLGPSLSRSPGRLTLVLWHAGEPRVVPLEAGRRVVLGRSSPAELVVEVPTLSREHVAITSDGAQVEVEDLGSKNGLRVGGARVERATLGPGEAFDAGGVSVLVTALPPGGKREPEPPSRRELMRTIEAELERSRVTGRPFTVAVIAGCSVAELGVRLRSIDLACELGPGLACALLPELDAPDAAAMLARGLPSARGGLAGPSTGETPAAIVDAARAALAHTSGERFSIAARRAEPEAGVIAASPRMRQVLALADRFAASDRPVLVLGETGSGKELVSQRIHASSPRRSGPFRVLNCGAIPPSLVESALFGHERGAFTGATERRRGPFEEASGGTLFLDEIGELPPSAQSALLRVLETGRLSRVGSSDELSVDVRVVAATHRDLASLSEDGRFRSDLHHRLSVLVIEVPPLRERPEDVVALAHEFVRRACAAAGRPALALDPTGLASLLAYDWPGNVRELRNVVERAVLLSSGPELGVVDLAERVRPAPSRPAARRDGEWELKARMRELEAELIVEALEACGGNQVAAAKLLGLPRRTLVHKIAKLGLRRRWERP